MPDEPIDARQGNDISKMWNALCHGYFCTATQERNEEMHHRIVTCAVLCLIAVRDNVLFFLFLCAQQFVFPLEIATWFAKDAVVFDMCRVTDSCSRAAELH